MTLLEINPKTKIGLFILTLGESVRIDTATEAKYSYRFGIYRVNNKQLHIIGNELLDFENYMNLISYHKTLTEAYTNFNKMHNYPLIILSGNKLREKLRIPTLLDVVTKDEKYYPIIEAKYTLKEGSYDAIGEVKLRDQLISSFKAHLTSMYGYDGPEEILDNNFIPRLKRPTAPCNGEVKHSNKYPWGSGN